MSDLSPRVPDEVVERALDAFPTDCGLPEAMRAALEAVWPETLTEEEVKALLWATAPYSEIIEFHDSEVVGRSTELIRSARGKLEGMG